MGDAWVLNVTSTGAGGISVRQKQYEEGVKLGKHGGHEPVRRGTQKRAVQVPWRVRAGCGALAWGGEVCDPTVEE